MRLIDQACSPLAKPSSVPKFPCDLTGNGYTSDSGDLGSTFRERVSPKDPYTKPPVEWYRSRQLKTNHQRVRIGCILNIRCLTKTSQFVDVVLSLVELEGTNFDSV